MAKGQKKTPKTRETASQRATVDASDIRNDYVLFDDDADFAGELFRIAAVDLLECATLIEARSKDSAIIERFRRQAERAIELADSIDAR